MVVSERAGSTNIAVALEDRAQVWSAASPAGCRTITTLFEAIFLVKAIELHEFLAQKSLLAELDAEKLEIPFRFPLRTAKITSAVQNH
jgi:hypothetical protein